MKKLLKILCLIFTFCIICTSTLAVESVKTQLGRIEQSIWGFEYSTESDSDRLKRIEQSVLGSAGKGSIEERVTLLSQTLGIESDDTAKKVAQEVQDLAVDDGISYPIVDRLEMQVLSKTYDGSVYTRLERLEKEIYGKKQEGDLDARLTRIAASVNIDVKRTPNETSDLSLQLSLLENNLFKKSYDDEPMEMRLARLESKIFQRDFVDDSEDQRLQRLQAASTAKKTAKYYDANKAAKYASTGMQIGTMILMILALIL